MKLEFKKILEGISNSIWVKEEVEKIAGYRIDICRKCPNNSKSVGRKGYERCLLCKCDLHWKTRSLSSSCPDEPKRWEAVDGVSDEQSNLIDEIIGND